MSPDPLHLTLAVGLADDPTPDELDAAARRLRRDLLDAGLEDVALTPGGPLPDGAKSVEAFLLGGLTLTLLPSALTTLVAVIHDWTGRRKGRTLTLAFSAGDQRLEMEYDPDKTDVQQLMALLVQAQAGGGAIAPLAGAKISGDVVSGDKVSHVNAQGDAVGRDKVTHVHVAPGSTLIINDAGVEVDKPTAPDEPAPA
jgi:hypothetical protein